MIRVPSDPAQVVVDHASFRVELAGPVPVSRVVAAIAAPYAVPGAGRRAPVVWSGRTRPGDTTARRLLRAVEYRAQDGDGAPTQVLPRLTPRPGGAPAAPRGGSPGGPSIVAPRSPEPRWRRVRTGAPGAPPEGGPPTRVQPVLHGLPPAKAPSTPPTPSAPPGQRPGGAADTGRRSAVGPGHRGNPESPVRQAEAAYDDGRQRRRGKDAVRHAYYPGRRLNLGIVLLPLRVFLGLISIYAGMGKLTNPVFFDGGEHGSLVARLRSLRPWEAAAPLHDFAVSHPVGSGLTVAFLQIIVGVLTIAGLWQRVAAGAGGLLSAALILTVSWRAAPVYEVPDFIFLAAWSPLIIAGAPVYSLDARLAGEAWRKLGPSIALRELRRRVLRRGAVIAAVLVGVALLVGSLLGVAVRSARVATVPVPGAPPVNPQPGSPLPERPGERTERAAQEPEHTAPDRGAVQKHSSPSPSAPPENSVRASESGTDGPQGTPAREPRTAPAPGQSAQAPVRTPRTPEAPPTTGGAGGDEGGDPGGTSGGGAEGNDNGDEAPRRGALGGLLG